MKKILLKVLALCMIVVCSVGLWGCQKKIPPVTADIFKAAIERVEARDTANTARVDISDFSEDSTKDYSHIEFYYQGNKTYFSEQHYYADTNTSTNKPNEYYVTENDVIYSVIWVENEGSWVKAESDFDKGHRIFEENIKPLLSYKNSYDKFEQKFEYDDKGKVVESNVSYFGLLPQYYSEFTESIDLSIETDNITSITFNIRTDTETLVADLTDIIIVYDEVEEDETQYQRQFVINFSEAHLDITVPEHGSENRYQ